MKKHIYEKAERKQNISDRSVKKRKLSMITLLWKISLEYKRTYYEKVYYSYEELKQAIIKYIDYYNNKRIKQNLGLVKSG